MTWDELCKLGSQFPEVTVDLWYGTPALMVRGKGFVRLKEDGENVALRVADIEEQQVLIEDKPKVYFITDHYLGSAMVLARLAKLTKKEAQVRLERAWLARAPNVLVKSYEASP